MVPCWQNVKQKGVIITLFISVPRGLSGTWNFLGTLRIPHCEIWSRYQGSCGRDWKQWQWWGATFEWLHRLNTGKRVGEGRWGNQRHAPKSIVHELTKKSWRCPENNWTRKWSNEVKERLVTKGAALSLKKPSIDSLLSLQLRLVRLGKTQIWLYRAMLREKSGSQVKIGNIFVCLLSLLYNQVSWPKVTKINTNFPKEFGHNEEKNQKVYQVRVTEHYICIM